MQGRDDLADFNIGAWATGDYVDAYRMTSLLPPEAVLVGRYVEPTHRVLELGCGTGRLTRVLAAFARDVHAIDVSPRMVEACRTNVPAAHVSLGDLRRLGDVAGASADVVVASNNILDVLGDAERRRTFGELRRILRPGGVLLFSSHNRGHLSRPGSRARMRDGLAALRSARGLARALWNLRLLPERRRNRRLARPHLRDEPGYAVVNDSAHANRLAHYHIGRDAQAEQLAALRWTLLECQDDTAVAVLPGAAAGHSPTLHYAARRT